jgi:hypothetical protein
MATKNETRSGKRFSLSLLCLHLKSAVKNAPLAGKKVENKTKKFLRQNVHRKIAQHKKEEVRSLHHDNSQKTLRTLKIALC